MTGSGSQDIVATQPVVKDRTTWDPRSVSSLVARPLETSTREESYTTILLEDEQQHQCAQIESDEAHYRSLVCQLRNEGELARSDQCQPSLLADKPSWFNEELFKNAQSVYERHFMGINFAHLSGLLLLVRVHSIYRTLSSTGESDSVSKLFKRYYHTLRHVKRWYEGDIFEENSDAYRSLLIVRGMHNKVSGKLNSKIDGRPQQQHQQQQQAEAGGDRPSDGAATAAAAAASGSGELASERASNQVHISQFDIMITQFAFVGLIVTNGKNMGLMDDFNRRDLESVLHFWRVIGHYLGASERFNLCSYELRDVVGLCDAIIEIEYKKSIEEHPIDGPYGIMSVNIVRALKFIPMLTIYGIMRYLYELLGHSIEEIEHKRNWYSKLSYSLIKLVMSNLLAYRPFRAFNNGLTRLSVFLAGKIEDWFARRLDASYGSKLKA